MATNKDLKTIAQMSQILKEDLGSLVESERENIIQGLVEMAKGIWVYQEVQKEGKLVNVKMYQKLPDPDVAQYLLNQFIGKPKQNVEVSGDPDKPLVVTLAKEVVEKYKLNSSDNAPSSTENDSK